MHAHPVPQDPYNPVPPMADETVRYPSPFVPIRLPVFAIVVWLNDLIVWVLSVGGGRRRGGGRPPARHSRTLSDWVEGVEEGDGMETSSVQGHWREMTVGRGNRSNVGGGIRAVGAGKSGRRRGE
jgi:etoposide-induced 2.4 mRNA